jgi:hypothetical protein
MRCAAPYESLLSPSLLTRRATAGPLYEVQRVARDRATGETSLSLSPTHVFNSNRSGMHWYAPLNSLSLGVTPRN